MCPPALPVHIRAAPAAVDGVSLDDVTLLATYRGSILTCSTPRIIFVTGAVPACPESAPEVAMVQKFTVSEREEECCSLGTHPLISVGSRW